MFSSTPIPNEEAAAMIANKPVFVREAYAALVPEIKARAFTLANIESAEILRNVRDLLAEVPRGADWTETRKSIAAELLKEWGAKATTEEERLKAISRAMIRAEFNLRLHVFQGYQAGRWQTMQRQKKVFPYWKYVAFGDSKVRPTHQALDGLILPADDPFWADHYPPWEWGCRCMVQAVSKADYEEAQARDAQRPAEERQILDEERLQRMRDSGQLTRNGQTMDVRSPRQKDIAKGGDGLNAFGWDPGTLKMDKAELQERYKDHPEAWTAFEASSKKQKLDDGRTVWEWMGGDGKAQPPQPSKPAPPAPPPALQAPRLKLPKDRKDVLLAARRSDIVDELEKLPADIFGADGPPEFFFKRGKAWYMPSSHSIHLNKSRSTWFGHIHMARHEMGHPVHRKKNIVTDTFVDPAFKDAMKSDLDFIETNGFFGKPISELQKLSIHEQSQYLNEALKDVVPDVDLRKHIAGGLADTLGALTGNRVGFGHDPRYLKIRNGGAKEAFANTFEAVLSGTESYKTTFPALTSYIQELLK
jgi:SPP1 gp7 family putative phage head morphogenesis protein